MVRFKHRYLVATIVAGPDRTVDLGPKDILLMLRVRTPATNAPSSCVGHSPPTMPQMSPWTNNFHVTSTCLAAHKIAVLETDKKLNVTVVASAHAIVAVLDR